MEKEEEEQRQSKTGEHTTTMKTRSEFRNVSVTAAAALSSDAYAMSHLAAGWAW